VESAYAYLGIWRQTPLERSLRHVFGAQLAIRLLKLLAKSVAIEHHRRRGRLILLDRYTCDAALPSSTADVRGRVSAWLTTRTCRTPDLILLLDAPVELMYARKGEHGLEELQQRRDAYLAMLEQFPQMVVVDVSQSPDDVRRQATELLWSRWTERAAGDGTTTRHARRLRWTVPRPPASSRR
jgi:thymidylate kinase